MELPPHCTLARRFPPCPSSACFPILPPRASPRGPRSWEEEEIWTSSSLPWHFRSSRLQRCWRRLIRLAPGGQPSVPSRRRHLARPAAAVEWRFHPLAREASAARRTTVRRCPPRHFRGLPTSGPVEVLQRHPAIPPSATRTILAPPCPPRLSSAAPLPPPTSRASSRRIRGADFPPARERRFSRACCGW